MHTSYHIVDLQASLSLQVLTKAVFTLGLDYDRIIIELNMKWVNIN